MLPIVLVRAGEAGNDVFVRLAVRELVKPVSQAVGIGGAAEIVEVVIVDQLRIVFGAVGDAQGDLLPRLADRQLAAPVSLAAGVGGAAQKQIVNCVDPGEVRSARSGIEFVRRNAESL